MVSRIGQPDSVRAFDSGLVCHACCPLPRAKKLAVGAKHARPTRFLIDGRCSNPSAYIPYGMEPFAAKLTPAAEPLRKMPSATQPLVVMLPSLPVPSESIASATVGVVWREILANLYCIVHFGQRTARVEPYCHLRP